MSQSESPRGFSRVSVPARIAGLAFSFDMPSDWRLVDLPPEEPNFDQPDQFFPLAIAMASYGAVLFTVAARPAFSDGAVAQWLAYVAGLQKLSHGEVEATHVGPHAGAVVLAEQESDVGTMRMRIAMFEDGERLVNVSAIAPAAIWDSVAPTLAAMVDSFALDAPRGGTAPVMPA